MDPLEFSISLGFTPRSALQLMLLDRPETILGLPIGAGKTIVSYYKVMYVAFAHREHAIYVNKDTLYLYDQDATTHTRVHDWCKSFANYIHKHDLPFKVRILDHTICVQYENDNMLCEHTKMLELMEELKNDCN